MFCNQHKNFNLAAASGHCQSCGGSTNSLGVKICVTCSVARKQCQVCRVPVPSQVKDPGK